MHALILLFQCLFLWVIVVKISTSIKNGASVFVCCMHVGLTAEFLCKLMFANLCQNLLFGSGIGWIMFVVWVSVIFEQL